METRRGDRSSLVVYMHYRLLCIIINKYTCLNINVLICNRFLHFTSLTRTRIVRKNNKLTRKSGHMENKCPFPMGTVMHVGAGNRTAPNLAPGSVLLYQLISVRNGVGVCVNSN